MKYFSKKVQREPDVVEKLEITEEHYPQGSAYHLEVPVNLDELGYVEEEYIIRGKADLYSIGTEWGKIPLVAEDAPYATRIIVRKPKDPKEFSGNVMIEAFNTATGLDHASTGWGFCSDEIIAAKDGWIGFTLGRQGIGFDALVRFDAERYDVGLGWPNPILEKDRKARGFDMIYDRKEGEGFAKGSKEDKEQMTADNADFERGLAHDVFYQIGAMAKSEKENLPFSGYNVRRVYGVGVAAFGTRLYAFRDGMVLEDGSQVIDGYVQFMAGPGGSMCREDSMLDPSDERAAFTCEIPIIKVETSGDLRGVGAHPLWGVLWRTKDEDGPDKKSRWYEIPGTVPTHDAGYKRTSSPEKAEYEKAGLKPFSRRFEPEVYNMMPRFIMAGAYHNIKEWVDNGVLPPKADYIETVGTKPNIEFVVDEFGNQKGGIRNPYVDVPVALYHDFEKIEVFSKEELVKLYGTKEEYVRRVKESAERLLQERWILKGAVDELVEQAQEFNWERD